MGSLLAALRSIDFLEAGPADLAVQFMSCGRSLDVPRGHVFWKTGQSPQGVVVPVSGDLAAVKTDFGGHQICYELVGPGECAGVPCALDGLPHTEEAHAIRAGEFFIMDRAAFLRFLDRRPEVRSDVAATVGRLFRRSLIERDRMAFLSVEARFARFLIERACALRTDGARILLRTTHAELAPRLGSVREVVARACASFIDQGIIRRTHHSLFIADWAGLHERAGFDRGEAAATVLSSDAAARTRRFFLPELGDAECLTAAADVCAELVADFTACAARGCPIAAARRAVTSAGVVRRPHAAAAIAPPPVPREHRAAAHATPHRVTVPRRLEEAPVRSPSDGRVVERRIEAYRARVATIESRFGGEERVPPSWSVFREPANSAN